jgi:NADH dehydrogenase (ubiquinone) 1 beta subcomplex subunit 9
MASRNHWFQETRRIRSLIEANKDETDPSKINRLIIEGEAEVQKYAHPDPYRTPFCYGSTLYGRNPPPPLNTIELDFGREKGTY